MQTYLESFGDVSVEDVGHELSNNAALVPGQLRLEGLSIECFSFGHKPRLLPVDVSPDTGKGKQHFKMRHNYISQNKYIHKAIRKYQPGYHSSVSY